ncbi:hypothetical protein NA56DRAFT_671728 [Hyaloscypha hepaticicola]|uniref:Rho-GAP domain-containing protein n=1 Tax=Hyaloscypha hepaticicola TaxID=2082293 RepID=A0A2J6Q023_9HELO|nr:hypothetical protein NA56DRAFT_671728 [Hyaloscypha hepaticicola]
MTRKAVPQPLTLAGSTAVNEQQYEHDFIDSPRSPLSLKSPKSPKSPFRFTRTKESQSELPSMQAAEYQTRSNLPPSQSSPSAQQYTVVGQENQEQPATKSRFFNNYKAAKSSSRLQNSESAATLTEDSMSRDTDRPGMAGRVSSKETKRTESTDRSTTRRPVGAPSKSDVSLETQTELSQSSSNVSRKGKPKAFNLLNRTKSIRDETSPRDTSPNSRLMEPEKTHHYSESLKTAPLPLAESDRSFRAMMSSNSRDIHQSMERKENGRKMERENTRSLLGKEQKENRVPNSLSTSFRESSSHGFLNNLKSSAMGKGAALSKGLFGKARSGSTHEMAPFVDDMHYELQVLNLPLVEQTRKTRISKKLEDSRDKTEFWMPSLPWRAIDYLNYKGSEVEGLYRVPGSSQEIKKWQRRFDEELDIDLFEQDDLYDINIIGSMLKAWLRELPDELFPKAAQNRIAAAHHGQEEVPQMLIDELSMLPPFNYYLLFAVTCHLSLLLAHEAKNKMSFKNLCICFQPCLKIDLWCFKWLVEHWRECWNGCKTEDRFIQEEYKWFERQTLGSTEGRRLSVAIESHDERTISSSDSSKPSSVSLDSTQKPGQSQNNLPYGQNTRSADTISTTLTIVDERNTPPRRSGDMRPLSPIKPLSPIGL